MSAFHFPRRCHTAAELVAGECIVHGETKDHLNWALLKVGRPHVEG